MPTSDKNITLKLSKEQYTQLMEWAMAGQSVFYAYHHPGKTKINQVNEFFQYLLEQGKDVKGFIQKVDDGYELTEERQQKIHRQMIAFVSATINEIDEQD